MTAEPRGPRVEAVGEPEALVSRLPSRAPVVPPPSGLVPARTPLAGSHVVLEPLDPARHAASLFHAGHAGEAALQIWEFLAEGPFASLSDHAAILRRQTARLDRVYYAVCPRDAGAALGQASFLDIDGENGTIEIGHIWFAPALQRTRAATEALYLMIRHALDDLGYRRVQWKCDALNARSRAAARRLGFRFEGLFCKHLIVKGRNRDTAWYAILDDDWPDLRGPIEAWLEPGNFADDGAAKTSLSEATARRMLSGGRSLR
jgi:RimJ/RimL family protein N-acetyltransferase